MRHPSPSTADWSASAIVGMLVRVIAPQSAQGRHQVIDDPDGLGPETEAADLRDTLGRLDDDDLRTAASPLARRLCTTTVPLGELFPTLAHRTYLTMPVRLLPARMHGPFGRRSWSWFVQRSPAELAEFGRVDEPAVGALLAALRTETAVVEERASR